MNTKDRQLWDYINKHYVELTMSICSIEDDYEVYNSNSIINKAIKMDIFQIGELVHQLSDETQSKLPKTDLKGIIDIRNYIAHGYIVINNKEIWNTIHNDLPRLIAELQKLFM